MVDLDNTLWGGIVGDGGKDGIALSTAAPGNSFMAFQQTLRDHADRGIILAINSRNNPQDALEVIRTHPNMILKENHFAAMRINWNDKVTNLKELALELNIGLDSMVFLDDDPTNRAEVRALLPQVSVPDLPKDPREYVKFLNALTYFEGDAVTDEDKMRGNLYVTERLRREEEKKFTNREEFLKSLGLELILYEDNPSNAARIAQLSEKTNQFNTFKKPLSEDKINHYIRSQNHSVFYGKLLDRFGDHGIIIFALIHTKEAHWRIESLVMSCRVFGRNVEEAFLATILELASVRGGNTISIAHKETEKNLPAMQFINLHFKSGEYDASQPIRIPDWIHISHETIQ